MAADKSAEGKAIWVIKGADVVSAAGCRVTQPHRHRLRPRG
jgi:hypothetical protein